MEISLRNFLYSCTSLALLGPNTLSTPPPGALSLCSSNDLDLPIRDLVSDPYKTTGKIIVLCVLNFTVLDSSQGCKRF
jgi:hypothetical protein